MTPAESAILIRTIADSVARHPGAVIVNGPVTGTQITSSGPGRGFSNRVEIHAPTEGEVIGFQSIARVGGSDAPVSAATVELFRLLADQASGGTDSSGLRATLDRIAAAATVPVLALELAVSVLQLGGLL